VGFVETSDTEGGGGRDGNELEEEVRDWALTKREDKRTVMIASWKMDVDILEGVVGVVEVRERKKGEEREEPTLK
jgi:hypothetical protein